MLVLSLCTVSQRSLPMNPLIGEIIIDGETDSKNNDNNSNTTQITNAPKKNIIENEPIENTLNKNKCSEDKYKYNNNIGITLDEFDNLLRPKKNKKKNIIKNESIEKKNESIEKPFSFKEFKEIISSSKQLVRYDKKPKNVSTLLDIQQFFLFYDFITTVNQFTKKQQKSLSSKFDDSSIENSTTVLNPYAEVLNLNNAEVCFMGDIHGSAKTLAENIEDLIKNKYLNDDLTISKDKFYMIFLGDYADHIMGGISVLYLLMKLQQKNPDHVFLIKGNHENVIQNETDGFKDELRHWFGDENATNVMNKMKIFYSLLPSLILLSLNGQLIHCSHGGFDPKLDVSKIINSGKNTVYIKDHRNNDFLIDVQNKNELQDIEKSSNKDLDDWLLWTDFSGDKANKLNDENGRFFWGFESTEEYKIKMGIWKFCHGHNHNGRFLKLIKKNTKDPVSWFKIDAFLNNENYKQTGFLTNTYKKHSPPCNELGDVLTFSTAGDHFGYWGNDTKDMVVFNYLCCEKGYGIISNKENKMQLDLYIKPARGSILKEKSKSGTCTWFTLEESGF